MSDLLAKAGLIDSSSTPTTMVGTPKLTTTGGELLTDVQLYRSIISTLQYVCITRPDISFSVNKLS